MPTDWFRFQVNTDEISERLGVQLESIEGLIVDSVKKLSVQAHAFIIDKANKELHGWKREQFLGTDENGNPKHVRWVPIAENIFVVEIDEAARWIEEGAPAKSMATEEWLLSPNGKSPEKIKTAKDGSKYRAIPFRQAQGKGKSANFKNPMPEVERHIKSALRQKGISLHKIEMDENGQPKIGIIHKLKIQDPGPKTKYLRQKGGKDWYSAPRNAEMAKLTGLKPHSGIFYGKDAVVIQRKGPRGGIIKEAVTFRTVSTKHEAEGRWMYPATQPFNSIEAAYEWAQQEWEKTVQRLQESLESENRE